MANEANYFKKGNKFGKGRPPIPQDLRKIEGLHKSDLKRIISKYLNETPEQLEIKVENPNQVKAIDLIVIKMIYDNHKLNFAKRRLQCRG